MSFPPTAVWGRLPLGAKLGSALVALGVVTLATAAVATAQLARVNDASQELASRNLVKTAQIGAVRQAALLSVADVVRHATAPEESDKKGVEEAIAADDKAFDEAWATYSGEANAATGEQADTLVKSWKGYRALRDTTLLPTSRKGPADVFFALEQSQARPLTILLLGTIDNMVEEERLAALQASASAASVYRTSRTLLYGLALVGILLGAAVGVLAVRSVVQPIRRVTEALSAVADGDLTRSVPVTGTDEVGRMSADLNRTVASIGDVVRRLTSNARTVAATSTRLAAVSSGIDDGARVTLERADAVAVTAAEVAGSTGAAAAGAEQLTASIHEIASSAAQAVRVGDDAVRSAEETNHRVGELGASSQQIGDVLSLISSIAGQTNLLALNATIEAARAGEAGKGFAVVATEVKDLAQQTASATGDIDRRITAIQEETAAAVSAIAGIRGIVADVNVHQTTIAGAVEEQTSVTGEISRSVSEAAAGAATIAETIAAVADAARATSASADGARATAGELAQLSGELNELVDRFRV